MIEGIPWPAITAASGGWILVAAYTYAVLSGRLVPRTALQDQIDEKQEWRTEARLRDAEVAEKNEQLRHMSEVGRNVLAIMHSIKAGPSGSDEVT